MLLNYVWPDDQRRLDSTPPSGTVIINSDKYPYTKTEDVSLSITVTDDISTPEQCFIAIINDVTYETLVKDSEEQIAQYEAALAAGEEVNIEDVYKFDWQPFVANKAWTLQNVEGIRTVYVYFKDGMGNISNIRVEF